LRRMLQRKVESPLSRKLLAGEFKAGDFIFVDADEKEGIVFRKRESAPSEQGAVMETPAPVATG
jgi:ATP-dependent Clp protease ATP-binding subunit ClpC